MGLLTVVNSLSQISDVLDQFYQNKEESSNTVRLHESTLGKDELIEFTRAYLEGSITLGKYNKRYEEMAANRFAAQYCVSSNSGSSANLLAVSALVQTGRLNKGDKVAVPSLAWSTTVFPLVQYGLVPVFVDIDKYTFNIDLNKLREAIKPYDVKALMLIHTYGNPVDMDIVADICEDYNLILIEDTCESMGATWRGMCVGSFGELSTFSSYFSHHICTLEGGLTTTSNKELYQVMLSIRSHGWTRGIDFDLSDIQGLDQIDPTFLFLYLGYNLRMSDPQAAMGCSQLPKLDDYIASRRRTASLYIETISNSPILNKHIRYMNTDSRGMSSWFGFPIFLKDKNYHELSSLRRYLLENRVESRPFLAGNFCLQPVSKRFKHFADNLQEIKLFHAQSFALPCHQGITEDDVRLTCSLIEYFFRQNQ
ncbi:DegT/DnrJ/EryC1/StrS family aminotransferase [Cyanobium sp. Alchichica 3B3-8F6]|uniref:DegT/DnrJ/EryC1/StrS family aminotransferase n=1 Tax=Cyanobium sp. Alchichica 3B3-8F6 TaxID=2823696 RepID=UPI0020CE628B|nr:DegT/DnrJ/EryC1/StrS family aminotransferase [Cyanobium sp. Alchichica 3B3-8F6]MCP9882391.1 DegT/DnrJ/EryC1/StrS family aminotransferase [Cyanobium sp. Alchichica 3B3-8F6]